MNPMLGQLNRGMTANLKETLKMLKASGNPMLLMQNAMTQNPQLKMVVDSANGDYQKAFYDLAKMRGINPDDILSVLK